MSFAATVIWGNSLSLNFDGPHCNVGPQGWAPFSPTCVHCPVFPSVAGAFAELVQCRLFLRMFSLEFQGDMFLEYLCDNSLYLADFSCFHVASCLSCKDACWFVSLRQYLSTVVYILTLKHRIFVLYDWIDVSGKVEHYLYKTSR